MKKIFLLAAILTIEAAANGQEARVDLGDTIITTGENFSSSIKNTAKNVTVVTNEEIEQKGAQTVAEALKGVPGLSIGNMDGSEPTFDLRGTGATADDNVIVLLNGIPLNGIGGGYNTSQIPISQVERIEVIPSGGAVMYGDGAIGGVINIITKVPEDKANYGSVGLEMGSWETVRSSFNYGTKIGEKTLLDIGYSGYRSADYRDRIKDDKEKDDTRENVYVKGRYLLDDGYLEARYNHYKAEDYYTGPLNKYDADNNPTKPGTRGGMIPSNIDDYQLTYAKKINGKTEILINGGYHIQDASSKTVKKKDITQQSVRPQVKYNYSENGYVILGGDYKKGEIHYIGSYTPTKKERESYAGFVLNKINIGNFQLTQGYRKENVKYVDQLNNYFEKEYKNDAVELAVNYLYSETGSVYVSYGDAYRTPHVYDLKINNLKDFKAQKTKTYELGLKDVIGNTAISSAIFMTETKDEIYYEKYHGTNEKAESKNFDGEVRRVGAELSLQHYFDKLTLRENVSYIQPKVTSGIHDGNEFAGVSRWQANVGATYNITRNWDINGDAYYRGERYSQDDFSNLYSKDDSVITVDVSTTYSFDTGLIIYGGVRNLFDETYYNTTTINQSANTKDEKNYYPANGRSVYAGFRYNF